LPIRRRLRGAISVAAFQASKSLRRPNYCVS
jgi:hypothetical protein